MTDPYETNQWEVYEMRPGVKRARSALCQHCLLLARPREDCHCIPMVKYIYGETARIPRDRLHVWLFRGIPNLHNFPNAIWTFPSNGCLGNITILYPLWFQESTSLWSWIRPCWHISESTTSGKAFTSSLSSTRWMAVRSSLEPQKTHPFVKDCKNPNAVEWKIYWSDYHNHSLLPKTWNQFLFNSDFWIPKGLWYVTKAQVDLSEFYGQPSGSPRSSNMSSFSSCVKWIGTSMITKSTRSSCLKRCRRLQGHRLGGWERGPWGDTRQKHGSIFGGPFHEPTSVGKFLWTSNSPYQA